MLKISFLVTFCGLLARMAQAQNLPCNQYPVILPTDTLNNHVAQALPPEYIAPVPKPVNDQTTGAQYTNLIPTGPPTVSCTVNTQSDGSIGVSLTGIAQYKGDITGPQPTKGVGCLVTNAVKVPYTVSTTPDGDIACAPPSSPDEAQVTCSTKPAPGGLLSGLLGVVLGLLDGLLKTLGSALQGLLKSTVPDLLKSVTDSLNGILKKVTDPKPVGDNGTCKQKVTTVKTSSNNCLNMVLETNKYLPDGAVIPPPAGTYIPPVITPEPDTGCKYAIPQQLINNALERIATTPYQVTGPALASLSAQIQALCGSGISLEQLVFKPTGTPQVTITQDKVSGTLTGNLEVFATGNPSPFLTASGTLQYTGTFEYANPCVMINLDFDAIGNVKLVNGPSCDVTGPVCQTFTEEIKGKATIKACVEPSPAAYLDLKGPTKITPSNGCVVVDHKKY